MSGEGKWGGETGENLIVDLNLWALQDGTSHEEVIGGGWVNTSRTGFSFLVSHSGLGSLLEIFWGRLGICCFKRRVHCHVS